MGLIHNVHAVKLSAPVRAEEIDRATETGWIDGGISEELRLGLRKQGAQPNGIHQAHLDQRRDIALVAVVAALQLRQCLRVGVEVIHTHLAQLGREAKFVNGLRVTDAETRDVALMVLAGQVNKKLVASICAEGPAAIGLCGGDG